MFLILNMCPQSGYEAWVGCRTQIMELAFDSEEIQIIPDLSQFHHLSSNQFLKILTNLVHWPSLYEGIQFSHKYIPREWIYDCTLNLDRPDYVWIKLTIILYTMQIINTITFHMRTLSYIFACIKCHPTAKRSHCFR